ncbi:tetratricopeptide repeat protein [Glycomyces luteolus]|uniref:Tetratricopeptide repeat protein n=1 Tax=Glycomyces luteolus TaxID=2670330 RepID=A0A9X3P6R0_9ACTN|nr:tetratricopeptide repeat protein [Glycomyces luteolus]MDA1359868.1 tetratricopeptide repeat protein [Glycomyces luteolus]
MRHSLDGLDPSTAGSAPQMVALLRELRAGSGLSIREVSRRARDHGDWLPTSTLAAVLNRDSLPRSEVVAALVRACGGDEAAVDTWLAQCSRIAAADVSDGGQVPRQLPPAPHAFTGRERELRLIGEHTREASPRAVVVAGSAGIGKTALVLHWAHRALDDYPDGQLYVDLRGFSGADPLAPSPVLQRFLTALGTDADEIPPEADERAAMYRSLLSHRRVLVVLDNARSPEQLRDLLPGTGGSAALITARTVLFGLTATHGVPHLRLAPLARDESMDLLGAMVGRGRIATDPVAARGLAAACGDLPLALRLAACQSLAHPEQALDELRDRIASAPLANLDLPGDEAAGLRSCLDLTRDRLEPAERKALDAIGLHPATEFEPAGIAAIAGTTIAEATAALHRLAEVHLAAPGDDGRWSVHDLVRAYARELAQDLPDRDSALGRLYDWHLATVAGTLDLLFGLEPEVVPESTVPVPSFAAPDDAIAWLDARQGALSEMIRHAASEGHPWHASRLASTLWRHQYTRGQRTETIDNLRVALDADRALGDLRHQGTVLYQIGSTQRALGAIDEAYASLTEARALAIGAEDRRGELRALGSIGWCHLERWKLGEARECAIEVARGFRELGDADQEMNALDDIAHLDLLTGDHESAAAGFERSIKIFAERGWGQSHGAALAGLALLRLRQEEPETAAELLDRALEAYRGTGDGFGQAFIRSRLANVRARMGDRTEAVALAEHALDATASATSVELRMEVLNNTGFTYCVVGDPVTAERLHREALDLAEAAPDPYEEARANQGLGNSLAAQDDQRGARKHWERALRLHESIGTYGKDEVAELLAQTPPHG